MKSLLKRVPGVYGLNSLVKDVSLSVRSWQLERAYGTREDAADTWMPAMLRARMAASGVRFITPGRRMHVFFVGTCYDHEGVGFLQALEKFGDITFFSNARGEYGLNPPDGETPFSVRDSNSRSFVEQVSAAHAQRPVDCVIGTMWAQYIAVDALMHARGLGIPVINMAMDDRLPEHWGEKDGIRLGAIGIAQGVDLTLQTTRDLVKRYLAEGCPAMYWAFGSDPQLFRRAERQDLDVVFVGNNYGKRGRLIAAITEAGIRVDCYGRGFPNGYIRGDEVPGLFGRAKIILGNGLVGHSSRIVTLKLRDFDGPMSGGLYLTTHNPDLESHYELGKEIVTYTSIPDCVQKLRHYLDNEAEREAIAQAGRARAARDHTWTARLGQAFTLLSASQ